MYARFWDGEHVVTRYIHSEFLGKARSVDIIECFDAIDDNGRLNKMLQVSMDGPTVNLSAHKKLEEKCQTTYEHGLLYMGTCGLHQVHNAVKVAMDPKDKDENFNMHLILMALYKLFHECPARRAEYTMVTNSDIFPQSFATHRWADNVRAAERAVDMLTPLKAFCNAHDGVPGSSRDKRVTKIQNASYPVVRDFVIGDKLAKVKLLYLTSLLKKSEDFLTLFQSDRPLAPFLIHELSDIYLQIARKFMSRKYCVDRKKSPIELIDPNDESQYRSVSSIDLGVAADKELNSLLESKTITSAEFNSIKIKCRSAYIRYLRKIKNKSPANYRLPVAIACLDPKLISQTPIKAVKLFNEAADCIVEANVYDNSSINIESVVHQFQVFVDENAENGDFKNFNYKNDKHRLDTLYYRYMFGKDEFKAAWDFISKLLVISHGQASVERGFSINKHASFVNQSEDSLVARRIVRDHINYVGGLENLIITKELLKHCKSAHAKYKARLEDIKRDKASKEKQTAREAVQKEIDQQQQKIGKTQDMCKHYDDLMQGQIKLVSNTEQIIVANPQLALQKIADYNQKTLKLKEELTILEQEMGRLKIKYKNV